MQAEEAINQDCPNEEDEVILQIAIPLTREVRTRCKVKALQLNTSITAQVREFIEKWVNEPIERADSGL